MIENIEQRISEGIGQRLDPKLLDLNSQIDALQEVVNRQSLGIKQRVFGWELPDDYTQEDFQQCVLQEASPEDYRAVAEAILPAAQAILEAGGYKIISPAEQAQTDNS